jgi:hypothetical protein
VPHALAARFDSISILQLQNNKAKQTAGPKTGARARMRAHQSLVRIDVLAPAFEFRMTVGMMA